MIKTDDEINSAASVKNTEIVTCYISELWRDLLSHDSFVVRDFWKETSTSVLPIAISHASSSNIMIYLI